MPSRLQYGSCLLLPLVFAAICGCREQPPATDTLSVWFHAGREAERRVIEDQIERYNAGGHGVRIEYTILPEGSYNGQVQAAALAGDLPDVLEFDGPYVYNYAWQGRLRPLDGLLPASLRDDLLPSILKQGTYRGHLYSVGMFDSGLALYARRSRLEAIDARIPASPDKAWSADEFNAILARLAANDPDGAVLDLKLNYGDEWFTYGFSPLLQSGGADLINRSEYRSADGVLNGPEAVAVMRRVQAWFQNGYIDPNLDDAAFVNGRVALCWVGHWEYEYNRAAVGDDLVLVPLPDFGEGTRTGMGSWSWGIAKHCRQPKAAMQFIECLLQPEEILKMTAANGAVPATRTAITRSDKYGPGGPLHLFADQLLNGYGVPRPRTPAYPVISSAFAQAFRAIRNGADVQGALDRAVQTIDQDIDDNHGYPLVEGMK